MSRTTTHAEVRESTGSAAPAGDGRLLVQLITPGWGSSGYYSQPVLEAAARDQVWPAGTHIFFDHPSESEAFDRPERSVRDLAGVLAEDARWDAAAGALVAEANVMGPYRDLVTDPVFVEAVGMSIRAGAETTTGEAEGRKGTIVSRLVEGMSVDLVTRAGRGGKVLAVLESARAQHAERAHASEAMTRETRDLLEFALSDNAWVVDFDPDAGTVVYRAQRDDDSYDSDLLQDGYTIDGDHAVLDGQPIEVRQTVGYVPAPAEPGEIGEAHQSRARTQHVPAPAGRSTTTQESEEDTMPQIEEARLRQLEEAAGRVSTLEAERNSAVERAENAERGLALHRAREAARPAVVRAVAESGLPARRQARIVADALEAASLDDAGRIDADAVVEATRAAVADAQEELAELAESLGAGQVRGFGHTQPATQTTTAEDAARAVAEAFGRTSQEA